MTVPTPADTIQALPTWAVVSVVAAMAAAIVAMALFIRWLVMKVISVVNTSTTAVVATKGAMDKLTKAVEHLTTAIEKDHQPVHKPKHR